MKLYRIIISGKLYSAFVFSIVLLLTSPVHSQKTPIQSLSQRLSQLPNQLPPEDNIVREGSSWQRFFPRSEPPEHDASEAGDERGDDPCIIAPKNHNNHQESLQVWSERPTLTWEGEITKLEIRELNSGKTLWDKRIYSTNKVQPLSSTSPELYQVTVETDLQPGQIYEWYFSDKPTGEYDEYLPVEFTVMTAQERELIAQGLEELEQELAAKNIIGDAAKLRRADYFASQKLWLEFWQEVLSMESPPEELKALLSSTVNDLCN